MHRLKFHGYSDDTFGEYGETGQDVDNYGSLEPVQCVIDCGEQGRLMVIGRYSKASLDNGCWMVGVSKVEEYDDFPDWKIVAGYCAGVEYSPEQIRELKERDTAKPPIDIEDNYGFFVCPSCGNSIYASDDFESHKFCLNCGQRLEWEE